MKIAIAGAGIAGLTAAIALNKMGFRAIVFEAAASFKPAGAGLGLAGNALKGLAMLDLDVEVRDAGSKLDYFEIRNQQGTVLSKTPAEALKENCSIHRAALHGILAGKLGADQIITSKRAIGLAQDDRGILLEFEDGSTYEADCLAIADGLHSKLRDIVAPRARVRYAGYTCWRAVLKNPGIALNGAVEIWGARGRFGYVPLGDDSIYWFACVNARSGKKLGHFTLRHIQILFEKYNEAVSAILSHTDPGSLLHDDIHDLEPLAKYAYGNIVLLGDAAHAATPNMGQGACQAIEDGVVLAKCLAENPVPAEAFIAYEKLRLERTHYIIRQSRIVGRMAQVQNIFLARVRDLALQATPPFLHRRQLDRINNFKI